MAEPRPPAPDERHTTHDLADENHLRGTLVQYAERPDQYTIFPRDADEIALLSTWITAEVEDVVNLDEWR